MSTSFLKELSLCCGTTAVLLASGILIAQDESAIPAVAIVPATEQIDTTEEPDITTPRNPFWPVGWIPVIEIDEPETNIVETNTNVVVEVATNIVEVAPEPEFSKEDWEAAERRLMVKRKRYDAEDEEWKAILSGIGVITVGQTVSIEYRGDIYTWRVAVINEKGVAYIRLDAVPK